MNFDYQKLKIWFLNSQREMPWRVDRTPYAVWISEMMLQQTQVSVVIPYFERWMKQFPTIQHLASAELDDVIKVWEGLGYYSRARFLHQGARQIIEQFNGVFPQEESQLSQIKGLGPYTVGAIRSFAFHQRAAAVDGNVMRVLTRYFLIKDDIAKSKTVIQLRKLALDILPEKESWIINEALIELGATICTRKPKCGQCPIKGSCQGWVTGEAEQLPVKSTKTVIVPLYRSVSIIKWYDQWLVQRGQQGSVMSDLHEFPYFESSEKGFTEIEIREKIANEFGFKVNFQKVLPEVQHSFTRYRVKLNPMQFECKSNVQPKVSAPYMWLSKDEMKKLAFSSGHRRIKDHIF
jgi:A/G-specific adenine glycosylase